MKYKISKVIFDTKERTLSFAGQIIELEAKSYQLLTVFVKYPQETLSRETLLKLAWNDSCVSDGAINKAIAKLRNHFELLIPKTTFIETKPKFGYLLCMPVQPCDKTSDFLKSKKY